MRLSLDDVTYISEEAHKEIYRRCPVRKGDVLYIKDGATAGIAAINPLEEEFSLLSSVAVLRGKPELLDNRFLAYWLNSPRGKSYMLGMLGGGAITRLTLSKLNDAEIPLPPLEEQRRIVAEIESYQKVIDGARQIMNAVEHQLHIESDWEVVLLGSICKNLDGKRRPITKSDRKPGPYPYYGASGVVDHVESYIFDEPLLLVSEDGANLLARSTPIAFSVSGKMWVNNHAHVLRFSEMATQRFVEHYLNSISIANYVTGAAQPKLNQAQLNSIEIPLPPLEEQRRIAMEVDVEAAQIETTRALIPRFEAKIQRVLDRVWAVSSSNTAANPAA